MPSPPCGLTLPWLRGTSERFSGPEVEPKRLFGHGEVQGDVSPRLPAHHESQAHPTRGPQVLEQVRALVEEAEVAHRRIGERRDVGEDDAPEEPVLGDAKAVLHLSVDL